MGALASYRLRLERKRWRLRALRKRQQLKPLQDNTDRIAADDVLLVATIWNERIRLPFFLRYYRRLGVKHFLIIDNCSDDGTQEYLARHEDVSVWRADGSYRGARYGMDWANWILRKYAQGHWTLTVDADEFFVFPFSDTRPVQALTSWLDEGGIRSFSAMLLDMYPKGPVEEQEYKDGQNPLEIAQWFDAGNYTHTRNPKYGNLWIQGGPRARQFFPYEPKLAPSLNKIPLVKWGRGYTYVSSTHMLLPRGLNQVYDSAQGERISGCLLHTKFLNTLTDKAEAEMQRRQHFAGSREYIAYKEGLKSGCDLWNGMSERYINWRQLEILGLMSKGNWA